MDEDDHGIESRWTSGLIDGRPHGQIMEKYSKTHDAIEKRSKEIGVKRQATVKQLAAKHGISEEAVENIYETFEALENCFSTMGWEEDVWRKIFQKKL